MARYVTGLPDLDAQEISALRRQKVADMLMGQALQPVQPFSKAGAYVAPMHWSQGMAQLAQALVAAKKGKAADAQLSGIADSRKRVADAAMEKFQAKSAGGSAGISIDRLDGGSDVSGLQYKADPEGAAIELAGNPAVPEAARQAGVLQYQIGAREKEQAAEREARIAAAEEAARERESLEKLRLEDKEEARRLASLDRRYVADQNADVRRDLAAATADKPQKPPKDYRWNADGTGYEVIPGSGADIKQKQGFDKEVAAHKAVESLMDAEIANIDKLIGPKALGTDGQPVFKLHPGLTAATGPISTLLPTYRDETANAEAAVESLQSKASIAALRDVRSGGSQSIGQITEREWPRLESMKATLQMKQGDEQFPKSLYEYREELLRTKAEAAAALEQARSTLGAAPAAADDGWNDL